jgi:Holliday junction resolvase
MAGTDDEPPDDIERLIQEVLARLGHSGDAADIARKVKRLNLGLPAEDEFSVICAWLGECRLVHKLDQAQAPLPSRDTFQVPDLLATFEAAGPVLIEVKSKKSQTLSFQPDYLSRLQAYAALVGHPLLIAWKFHNLWTLFDVRRLQLARTNFNITHERAMKENLLGMLAGDVAYVLGPGAGVHFECAKEELVGVEGDTTKFTETWKMRIADVFFTAGDGSRRDDLHGETKQLFATWDLQTDEAHSPTSVRMGFIAGDGGVQFAHSALVHLLSWEGGRSGPPSWRHLLRAPKVTRTIDDFGRALDRALGEKVVHYIFHQVPQTLPDFLQAGDDDK